MVYISLVFWIARSLFSESNCQIGGMLDSVRGISNSTVIEVVFYGMFLLDSVRGIYSSCFFGMVGLCFPSPIVRFVVC
jgi:hypothetical protein